MMKSNYKDNNTIIRYSFLLILVSLISGCGAPEIKPARYSVFSRVKSIAVLPFQGKGGVVFADELESTLVNLQNKQGVTFRVATRTRGDIHALEEEIDYQQKGATKNALQLGKAMQVTSIMTGQIETTSNSDRFARTVDECIKPKGLFGCAETRPQTVYCSRITVRTRVVPRLLDVESGQVLYSHIVDGIGVKQECSLDRYSINTDPYKAATDQVLKKIAEDVAPYTTTTWNNILNSTLSGFVAK